MTTIASHQRKQTLRFTEFFPQHEPRADDKHYRLFHEAREKLRAAGKLVCWICGKSEREAGSPIELHHAWVEQALINGVDIMKFIHRFPEFNITDDESFFNFCESEGNLTCLCVDHHRGAHGIHCMTYSPWVAQAFWKDDLPAPAIKE